MNYEYMYMYHAVALDRYSARSYVTFVLNVGIRWILSELSNIVPFYNPMYSIQGKSHISSAHFGNQ